jgi:hypothetical protein
MLKTPIAPLTKESKAPTSTLDPYTDQALLNPWPLYRELREMGPAVRLEKYGMFARSYAAWRSRMASVVLAIQKPAHSLAASKSANISQCLSDRLCPPTSLPPGN